ncbi:MAG: hypothetical protein HRT99_01255 [Mycoplasmatales bacterium]|nr:hypothetical protein [Mycoplasmatales bacterium]
MFNWLMDYSLMMRALIVSSIIIGFLVFILIFIYFFKPSIKRKNFLYFYAFSAGFLIIVSILGLYNSIGPEARKSIYIYDMNPQSDNFMEIMNNNGYIWKTALIIISVIASSMAIIFLVKYLANKSMSNKNQEKTSEKRRKIIGIIFMLTHRIPASILIGSFLINPVGEDTALFAILLHLIPEALVVFYRQIDAGLSKRKAFVYSIFAKLFFLPAIFIFTLIGNSISDIWWFKIALYAFGGTFLLYAAINELTVDFLEGFKHRISEINDDIKITAEQKKSNLIKLSTSATLVFAVGIAFAASVMSFHYH